MFLSTGMFLHKLMSLCMKLFLLVLVINILMCFVGISKLNHIRHNFPGRPKPDLCYMVKCFYLSKSVQKVEKPFGFLSKFEHNSQYGHAAATPFFLGF